MTCTHDCNQGRDCPARQACELPLAPGDGFTAFDYIMRWLWTGMAWLGFFSMLAIITFLFGYMS